MTMRSKNVTLTPQNVDDNGICEAQTTAGAVAMLINGALASGGTVTLDVASQIGIYCAADINTIVFTVVGTNPEGVAQTGTITGVNAGTVESTEYWKTVTSVTTSAAVGTNTIVGTVDEFASKCYAVDIYTDGHTVGGSLTGTANYKIQYCLERFTAGETLVWIDTSLTNKTAASSATLTDMVGGFRIVENSFTDWATLSLRINTKARIYTQVRREASR
jgi:hypothetical protein